MHSELLLEEIARFKNDWLNLIQPSYHFIDILYDEIRNKHPSHPKLMLIKEYNIDGILYNPDYLSMLSKEKYENEYIENHISNLCDKYYSIIRDEVRDKSAKIQEFIHIIEKLYSRFKAERFSDGLSFSYVLLTRKEGMEEFRKLGEETWIKRVENFLEYLRKYKTGEQIIL